MMHVDKNACSHVVDQNGDRISREIAYVPLGGGIRSKRSSCMQFFFFWMSTRYAYLEDNGSWLMFSDNQGFSGLWLMFLEDQKFWILTHVFRALGFLDLGSCFRRTKDFFGLWLMFSEDQRFCILAYVFRDLGFLDLGLCFQTTKGFGALTHVFRRPKVLDLGSCF